MTNVTVLVGRLARPAEERALPSGDRLVSYEVTVPRESGKAESVPVVWFDAPAAAVRDRWRDCRAPRREAGALSGVTVADARGATDGAGRE